MCLDIHAIGFAWSFVALASRRRLLLRNEEQALKWKGRSAGVPKDRKTASYAERNARVSGPGTSRKLQRLPTATD